MAIMLLLVAGGEARAQISDEVVVTAMRRDAEDYSSDRPAVGLVRVADFAVQKVLVTGDTRDTPKRREEIYATVRAAIERAGPANGIALAVGEDRLEPLTAANYRNLPLVGDGRPDAERTSFLIKAALGSGTDGKAALDRIAAFIGNVPVTGRAELKPSGDLTLSVVKPDQYRGAIIDLLAADAQASAARLGPDYQVEMRGIDRPVEWARASLTDVFLYLPAS